MGHYLIRYRPPRETFIDDITDEERTVIEQHFVYLQKLMDEGKLVMAGRTDDAELGISVICVETDEEASIIMGNDPAVKAGIFRCEVKSFLLALLQKEA